MTVNKEALQKTIDLMKFNESMRLNMEFWIEEGSNDPTDGNWCGTTACIAGYVTVAQVGIDDAINDRATVGSYSHYARNILGITEDQRRQLFYAPTYDAWNINKEQAIRLLEHLRDTGKVDWSVIGFYNLKEGYY